MYDTSARADLEEIIGYEKYVISEVVELLQLNVGIVVPGVLKIEDKVYIKELHAFCRMDSLHTTPLIQQMSPLLFCAGYKLLDMLIEWIIKENEGTSPWKFTQKINILQQRAAGISLPSGFQDVFEPLCSLYMNCVKYRNAITHGKWGENANGTLKFDFTDKQAGRILQDIDFDTVIIFSECIKTCVEEAITPNVDSDRIRRVKWFLDKLSHLHQKPRFDLPIPSYYRVTREISDPRRPVVVDVKRINQIVSRDAKGANYSYELTVIALREKGNDKWMIPSTKIGENTELVLDENWEIYQVN